MQARKWPWIGQQNWQDVLFIHFPVSADDIRPFVPQPFQLDMFAGNAWVSVILFNVTKSRLRWMPSLFSYPSFLQMNVRTYVRFGDEPGVFFFSIHSNSKLVKWGGQLTALPYKVSAIKRIKQDGQIQLEITDRNKQDEISGLNLHYTPSTDIVSSAPSTAAYFLTERYCIWIQNKDKLIKAPISHSPWQLQTTEVRVNLDQFTPLLPVPPKHQGIRFHYSPFKHAKIHPFEKMALSGYSY